MTVHNYRSRQVHETLNGVNPSSGFRDMRSAKSGPNLWQIWQVFGPWASPYGANGRMSMTVHNYRPRQFHRTSNGENPSSGYRDMGSASLAAARPTARPPARPPVRPPARPPARPDRDDNTPTSPEGWGVKSVILGWPNKNFILIFNVFYLVSSHGAWRYRNNDTLFLKIVKKIERFIAIFRSEVWPSVLPFCQM